MISMKGELVLDQVKSQSGKIKITKWTKAKCVMTLTWGILIALTIYSFVRFDYKELNVVEAIIATGHHLHVIFLQPSLQNFSLFEALIQVMITVGLGFIATIVGAVLSLVLAIFTARNLSPKPIANAIMMMMAVIRAIPTVLWVLIFAIAAGLGAEAAVLGMLLHTVAFLVKAFSESIEDLDDGMIEALKASGASFWHIVIHVVIPSTMTSLLSWTFLRFETNFTVAVAMGAAAGAGGIGFELFMASGFYFDLREVGLITYIILIVAILLEITSTQIKKKYLSTASVR